MNTFDAKKVKCGTKTLSKGIYDIFSVNDSCGKSFKLNEIIRFDENRKYINFSVGYIIDYINEYYGELFDFNVLYNKISYHDYAHFSSDTFSFRVFRIKGNTQHKYMCYQYPCDISFIPNDIGSIAYPNSFRPSTYCPLCLGKHFQLNIDDYYKLNKIQRFL